MRASRFQPSREDGRSQAEVLIEYVKCGEPGQVYSYAELARALGAGSSRIYTIREVRQAVAACVSRLLREHQRRLHNIRLVGYRVAPAVHHMSLAKGDRRRADRQLLRGLQTLRHVRWEEMDENTRRAHEGHLMIHEAVCSNQHALDVRLRKVEEAIRRARDNEPPKK